MPDAADLLGQTLQEEKAADEKLTALAESEINVEADDESQKPRRTSGRRSVSAERTRRKKAFGARTPRA